MKLLAIVPCLNEAKNLPRLLSEFAEPGIDFLVIDDGSTDDTYAVAMAHGRVLRLCVNLGIGGAVQTGIRFAHRSGYDFCVQVDGDGQHLPSEISKLVQAQKESGADLVIGSRFLSEASFRSTAMRRLGINLLRWTLRTVYRSSVQDPTSGFRLFNRRAMQEFSANYPQDFPEPIALAIAANHGLKVVETPVRMREREHGQSSIRGLKTVLYMLRVVCYLIILRLGKTK